MRRILYMAALVCLCLKDHPFGNYYQYLVKRGVKGRDALMVVMHKLLICAYSLLKSGDSHDPQKVWDESEIQPKDEKVPPDLAIAAIGA